MKRIPEDIKKAIQESKTRRAKIIELRKKRGQVLRGRDMSIFWLVEGVMDNIRERMKPR